jgi:hypothetical protein
MSTVNFHRPTSHRAIRRRTPVSAVRADPGFLALAVGGVAALVALPGVLVGLSLLLA